jgi:hypothetical protein
MESKMRARAEKNLTLKAVAGTGCNIFIMAFVLRHENTGRVLCRFYSNLKDTNYLHQVLMSIT